MAAICRSKKVSAVTAAAARADTRHLTDKDRPDVAPHPRTTSRLFCSAVNDSLPPPPCSDRKMSTFDDIDDVRLSSLHCCYRFLWIMQQMLHFSVSTARCQSVTMTATFTSLSHLLSVSFSHSLSLSIRLSLSIFEPMAVRMVFDQL